jgi:hypothetical protein
MIFSSLLVDPATFLATSGWEMKPQGACRGDRCLPLRGREDAMVDVAQFAARLGMPFVHDEERQLYSLGPEDTGGRFHATAECPELVLPDLNAKPFDLASLRGKKVVLVAWAPWCGCGYDLPVWQKLREDWFPQGLEIVSVSLDSTGGQMARAQIEAANAEYPCLIDAAHRVDQVFGIRNVPEGVWIDENGVIVRPAEPAAPQEMTVMLHNVPMDENSPEHQKRMMDECWNIDVNAENYVTAVRDWVENGARSQFALTPEEVLERSRPRSPEVAVAAAEFALGQHLHERGDIEGATTHFREAHRLQPENWTYRRQAWHFADPTLQGPAQDWPYDSDWLTETRKVGAQNYYDVQSLDQMKTKRGEHA